MTTLKSKKRYLNRLSVSVGLFLFVALMILALFPSFWFFVGLLMAFQAGLILLLVFRRKSIYIKYPDKDPEVYDNQDLFQKVRKYVFDEEDKTYSWVFLGVVFVGLFFYLTTIFSIRFVIYIGPLSFIFFAFGTLLILGNGITLISVFYRINVHMIVFFFAFIVGLIFEPHDIHTSKKENNSKLWQSSNLT